ncbi:alpha1 protein [Porcine ephemerovirus 2]|uniref:Alpha1 protein n=1 Tax=Porcine ephemerovirus 2 TaxID=2928257 RepID=A0AAX3A6X4_9RHAB|nr:alpha1 protein [Porcine ephemerovirus 2]UNP42122.1 alpha1 protein [Porcine ephemerovirus 2]
MTERLGFDWSGVKEGVFKIRDIFIKVQIWLKVLFFIVLAFLVIWVIYKIVNCIDKQIDCLIKWKQRFQVKRVNKSKSKNGTERIRDIL